MGAETVLRGAVVALCAIVCVACGAKTGLRVPELVADASIDGDAATPVVRCFDRRYRTTVGRAVELRAETDVPTTDTFRWSLVRGPTSSRATVTSTAPQTASFQADVVGEYLVRYEGSTLAADGGRLGCSITLTAEPADERCPGYTIVEPQVVSLSPTGPQLALDPGFVPARIDRAGDLSVVTTEDPVARVAAFAFTRPVRSTASDPARALDDDAVALERTIERDLAGVALLVGRSRTTQEGLPSRRSWYRTGVVRTVDGGDVRNRIATGLSAVPVTGSTSAGRDVDGRFYLDISFVLDAASRRLIVIGAIAPMDGYDNFARPTAVRVEDLVNVTGLRVGPGTPVIECHEVGASRTPTVDMAWHVDVSGSMDDDQERVGATAFRAFQRLQNAGVDFRMGVLESGFGVPDLEVGRGFAWISGSDPNGARWMSYQVTRTRFRGARDDSLHPYVVPGDQEEPVAGAVQFVRELERRAARGERNPEFRWREGAVHSVFFVTDEPGTNDDERFFSLDVPTWGATPEARIRSATNFFRSRNILPFGLLRWERNGDCVSGAVNLPSCVVTMGGGAFIPIDLPPSANHDAAFEAAMLRVIDAVIGASSEFVLPHEPVSSTLRVHFDTRVVPSSRNDGVEFDVGSRALVFRGSNWRPARGQRVRVAYVTWR